MLFSTAHSGRNFASHAIGLPYSRTFVAGSIRGGTPADLDEGSEHGNKRSSLTTQSPGAGVEEDDFQKALKNLEMKSSQEKVKWGSIVVVAVVEIMMMMIDNDYY